MRTDGASHHPQPPTPTQVVQAVVPNWAWASREAQQEAGEAQSGPPEYGWPDAGWQQQQQQHGFGDPFLSHQASGPAARLAAAGQREVQGRPAAAARAQDSGTSEGTHLLGMAAAAAAAAVAGGAQNTISQSAAAEGGAGSDVGGYGGGYGGHGGGGYGSGSGTEHQQGQRPGSDGGATSASPTPWLAAGGSALVPPANPAGSVGLLGVVVPPAARPPPAADDGPASAAAAATAGDVAAASFHEEEAAMADAGGGLQQDPGRLWAAHPGAGSRIASDEHNVWQRSVQGGGLPPTLLPMAPRQQRVSSPQPRLQQAPGGEEEEEEGGGRGFGTQPAPAAPYASVKAPKGVAVAWGAPPPPLPPPVRGDGSYPDGGPAQAAAAVHPSADE